ncbi:MAG: hypothetical protein ACRDK7_01635 [Solirubrobacteraceae bacterium]
MSAAPRITGVSSTNVVSGGGEHRYATQGLRSLLTSSMQVSDAAGVKDQGQISKLLMMRLEGHGLMENTGGQTKGDPNAWRLTPHGEEVLLFAAVCSRASRQKEWASETGQGRGAKRPAGVPGKTPRRSARKLSRNAEMRRSSCSKRTVPDGDVLIKATPPNFHSNGRVNTVNLRPLDGCDVLGASCRSAVIERFLNRSEERSAA